MVKLKVLFVDDEILVRVGLKSIINWDNYGCEVIGEASDGIRALEIVKNEKPDIIFTDIVMPKMNGLEFIQKVRSEYGVDIFIVILTSFDEFNYAKQAIKLGVEDYILKLSLDSDTIISIIQKIRNKVEQSSNKVKYFTKNNIDDELSRDSLKSLFVKMILDKNKLESKNIPQVMEDLQIKFPENTKIYLLMAISLDQLKTKIRENIIIDEAKFFIDFNNISKNKLNQHGINDIFKVSPNTYIIIAGVCEEFGDLARNIFDGLNFAYKNYLNATVSMGISTVAFNLNELPEKVNEALVALSYKFYKGNQSCNNFNYPVNDKKKDTILSTIEEEKLFHELLLLHELEAQKIIEEVFQKVELSHNYPPKKIINQLREIVYLLARVAKNNNGTLEEMEVNSTVLPFAYFDELENVFEIKSWFKTYLDTLILYLKEKRNKNARKEISLIKDYVEQNYMENISLSYGAKYVSMSENYFSSLFKKETGENFTNYVIRIKIEKAYEMIIKDNLRVYEAAEKVGFNNMNYFSNVFKKITGVTPSSLKR